MVILDDSHSLRPKVTVAELKVILEAMEKAGFHRMYGNPRFKLYDRITQLTRGNHYKKRGRIRSLIAVHKADELEAEVEKILASTQEGS